MNKVKVIYRLLKYSFRYKWKVFFLIVLGFAGVGFSVLQPLPIKFIIDNVLSNHQLPKGLRSVLALFDGSQSKMSMLILFVIASILIVLIHSLLNLLSTNMTTKVCQKMVHDFSTDLFEKLQKLSLSFYSKHNVGDLMQRISADTYVIFSIIGGIILPSLFSLISLVSMFYIMYMINGSLAFMAISIVPLFAILLYGFNKPMTNSTTYQYELSGKLWSFLQQSLSSVKMIQAFSREGLTNKSFVEKSKEFNDASVRSTKISMLYTSIIGIITGIATAVIVGIGAYKGLNGIITTGDLFLFISYIAALYGPVSSLAGIAANTFTITARAKRIFEVLDSEEMILEKPDAIDLPNVKGDIEFRNISFGYGKREEVNCILKNVNLEVKAGNMIAIVGPTGAGKSSIISLLLRFYDPWEGQVLLDGINIKDIKLKSLRKNISLVLQESPIFPVSIAENIAFGNPGASRDEIISAAKAAQAHDFIMQLPQQYDTIPSEGGVSMSGGEKQRISIARAFLKSAPILIMDEPSSALDVQTEAQIFQALKTYASNKTVFIISHRLSTIKQADVIVALKDGELQEKGTHETLLKHNKVYAELHKFQNKG